MTRLVSFPLLAVLALCFAPPVAAQAIYHVDGATGADDNAGTSWDAPFATLTKALDVATGDDAIWIAEGTYYPDEGPGTADNDTQARFQLSSDQDGLAIYGGFQVGDAFSDRNPGEHPVILSGDLEQNDARFAPRVDTDDDVNTPSQTDHIVGANAAQVIRFQSDFAESITNATILDGVTITGAAESGGAYCDGGNDNVCSPTLVGLVVFGNFANDGGGLYNDGAGGESSPTIINCVFAGNAARNEGGALYNDGEGGISSPRIINTTFVLNTAFGGGAILNDGRTGFSPGASEPELTNVILFGNESGSNFTEDEIENSFATPTIRHSLVAGSGGSAGWDSDLGTDGGNNIDVDPGFVDPMDPNGPDGAFRSLDDGLYLDSESPALDAGTNAPFETGGPAEAIAADVTGMDRFRDDDTDGMATVDLGAYEGDRSTIPVELTSLQASTDGSTVILRWQTASETSNAGFAVERRHANRSFERIGFVDGAGTTSAPQTYRFRDLTPPLDANRATYRLRQIDVDGTESVSRNVVVTVNQGSMLALRAPVPNPTSGPLTVRYALTTESPVRLSIFNALGQEVRVVHSGPQSADRHHAIVSTRSLASGLYLLRLVATDRTATQRFMVVR